VAKLTASEQIIAEKTVCILLIRGENPDGGKMYAYVAVRADKLEGFMEAQKSGTFFPEDYGMILESGEAMMDIDGTQGAHDLASNISGIVASAGSNKKDGDA
jgi:hypothetical protein